MVKKSDSPHDDALPRGLGAPATRALGRAGITSLSRATNATERDLLGLHGFGPKALAVLKAALAERGLALARREDEAGTDGKGGRS